MKTELHRHVTVMCAVCALVLWIVVASPARSEEPLPSWHNPDFAVQVAGGMQWPLEQDEEAFSLRADIGAAINCKLHPRFAVQAAFRHAPDQGMEARDIRFYGTPVGDYTPLVQAGQLSATTLMLSFQQFLDTAGAQPFIDAGIGWYHMNLRGWKYPEPGMPALLPYSDRQNRLGLHVGGGIVLPVFRRFSLVPDFKYHLTDVRVLGRNYDHYFTSLEFGIQWDL